MAFSFTTDIFNYMDMVTKDFVASNLGIVISAISPVIGLALICKLTLDGLFTLARPQGEPLSSLIKKFIVWSIIISFASAGGLYQTELADAAMKIPDEFSSVLIINGSHSSTENEMGQSIDKVIHDGMQVARTAFDNADINSGSGLASLFLACAIIFSTVLLCGIGAGLVLMAKLLLAVAVCFGPIFIFCLLFKPLYGMFNKWLGSIVNYGMVSILLSMLFGLMIKLYQKALDAVAIPGADSSLLGPVFACLLILVIAYLVLMRIPEIASRWGDGISASIQELVPSMGSGLSGGSGGGHYSGGQRGGKTMGGMGQLPSGMNVETGSQIQGFAKGSRR
jgi:type IV secretion system protein VirB6